MIYRIHPYIYNGKPQWAVIREAERPWWYWLAPIAMRMAVVDTEEEARSLVEHIQREAINP